MVYLLRVATLCGVALFAALPSFAQSNLGNSATALVSEQWPLRRADGGQIGILTHATTCGDRVFLLALTRKTIYLADLKRRELTIALGPDVLGNVSVFGARADLLSMFVDCEADALSVVVPTKLVSFALKTGQPLRTYEFPQEFAPTKGLSSYDRTSRRAFLTGLWTATPAAWVKKPVESMFSDTAFGLMLSMDNGSMNRFLPRAEEGCRSFVGDCLDSSFAYAGDAWVFGHKVSTTLAFVRAGKIVRTFDVRSPKFLYNPGDALIRGAQRDEVILWGQRNSTIRDIFVVGGQIVAVHSHHVPVGPKPMGTWVQFDVFANIFTVDGKPVQTDLRLPDLPVGADDKGVWVVSYPPPGRNNESTSVVLHRIVPRPGSPGQR
jgi:predicted small integral membrane protein